MPASVTSRLFVVRKDGTTGTYNANYRNNMQKGIEKLKKVLESSEFGKWAIAYIYRGADPVGTPPLMSFHPSRGTIELDKITAETLRRKYNNNIREYKYKAYCIPSVKNQIKGQRCYTLKIKNLDQARQEIKLHSLKKVIIYTKTGKVYKTIN